MYIYLRVLYLITVRKYLKKERENNNIIFVIRMCDRRRELIKHKFDLKEEEKENSYCMIFIKLVNSTYSADFLRKCTGNLRTLVACQLEFSLLMISGAFYLNLQLAECKIVTWDTRTGVSHTRLVFMVPRTSVTVCKSVLTYSLLHVVARTRTDAFDLRIAGVTGYTRTYDTGNIIALRRELLSR